MPQLDGALCIENDRSHFWLSYNETKIEYAKAICKVCPALLSCAAYMLEQYDDGGVPLGVLAGTSEFDRLELLWKEVDDGEDSNWARFDKLIPKGM
tara:strand:- start:279 stop:566 length:288 start_codon:yes stop_codon:yes gene_type:complete